MNAPQITDPGYLIVTLTTGASIRGRFVTYTDPETMDTYGVFSCTDSDGTTHYVHGGAILHVAVFPLTATPPPADD